MSEFLGFLRYILQIQKYVEAAEMVMDPVVECVRPLYPAKIWEDLRWTYPVALSMSWWFETYDKSII